MHRLEKKLQTLKLLTLAIFFSSAAFCAAELVDPSPEELTRTYLGYLPHSADAVETPIASAEKGITHIARILKQIERLEHSYHVKNKPSYGCSFTIKNEQPIQFIVHALTGRNSWKKELIESLNSPIAIADVGCGLGFSTISVVLQTLEVYEKDRWELKEPINIDLYDISSEHEEPLTALAALINMAFPKYFRIRTFVHDATEAFPKQNHYRLAMGFNFMHYVPQTNWSLVLKNLENSMKKGGMLFLTADHYLCGLDKEDADQLESSIEEHKSPFVMPTSLLFSKRDGKAKGTLFANPKLLAVLKEGKENTPGHKYTFDET
jgi:SAM-dependent methyltransferase